MDMEHIIAELLRFRQDRCWEQFHSGLSLSHKLMVEAAEVAELFEWGRQPNVLELSKEVADVLIILMYLSHDYGINIVQSVWDKIKENELKYQLITEK